MNDEKPKHLDLFSGIGGFSLAFEREGFETIGFSETDPYASAVLKKHWPAVKNYGDIRNIRGGCKANVVTGGFPCQPFSISNQSKSEDDSRKLWPEMLRVIEVVRPEWIVGENVAEFARLGLDGLVADLEAKDYSAEAFIIPAIAVGTIHRRDRVWIIGHSNRERLKECGDKQHRAIGDAAPSVQWPTESPILGADDGVSSWVDRIRCLGNTIVPQIPQIFAREIRARLNGF